MSETARRSSEPTKAAKVRLGANYWRLWIASVISNLGDGIGAIAYPWLASAVTRNGFLIALIAVAQRLPWLVFTLPAGVITDRVDRRKIMVAMDVVRAALTLLVAFSVLANEGVLPAPEALASGDVEAATNLTVYLVLLLAALLLGFAEVLRDNSAQTILPAIVEPENLEKANGNLWGAEMVANSFVGPPLGSVLLGVGFAFPFFFDAGSFAVAAALVFLMGGTFRPKGEQRSGPVDWRGEIKEGFNWLWHHSVLRPMAIVLGFLNGLGMMVFATFVLFAQEDLDLSTGLFTGVLGDFAGALGFETVGALVFAILMMGGAIGGILGSVLAPKLTERIGSGPSLALTILSGIVTMVVTGITTRWWIAFLMSVAGVFTSMMWNIITVSFRQTIIPDNLLGRVNSVYRFFGWGMMPIGSAIGGLIVAFSESIVGRSMALRMPFFVAAASYALLFLYAAPRLTTEKLDAAREAGRAEKAVVDSTGADDATTAIAESGITGAPPPIDEDEV
ncbi:MAG: MFS transporter [Acidimicrobiia bacterium]|nr:MFS transporter [Acidimicrobiia bacterium]